MLNPANVDSKSAPEGSVVVTPDARSATDGFVFAHLSDPHLSSLERVPWRKLANKRLLGYLSWRTGRRHEHLRSVLDALIADLAGFESKHMVITGDLTHIGLPQEFRQVEQWLHSVGAPQDITVIPGNHDMTVGESWGDTFAHWAPYMASDGQQPKPDGSPQGCFPSLRVRNGVAFIGVSSARPSAPLLATGALGAEQLQEIERLLIACRERGLFRVLLLHHPPQTGTVAWRKRLTDAGQLRGLVAEHGIELVLHGHAHEGHRDRFAVPGGQFAPVFGVASASAVGQRSGDHARYHLHRLRRADDGWELTTTVRGYAGAGQPFDQENEYQDLIGAP